MRVPVINFTYHHYSLTNIFQTLNGPIPKLNQTECEHTFGASPTKTNQRFGIYT